MNCIRCPSLLRLALLSFAWAAAMQAQAAPAAPIAPTPPKLSLYVPGGPLDLRFLVPAPPAVNSPAGHDDLAAVQAAQAVRTPAQIAQAQRDDHEESIFAYATVLGPGFTAVNFPLTAALSLHLRGESAVVNPALKRLYARPRPFLTDPTLHPVCDRTASASYPSGHAMVGYLEAFALAEIVPEQRAAILTRAQDFAHNRVVCGVHYPSDVEASHTLALALFGAVSTSTRFQQELAAARREVRTKLGMSLNLKPKAPTP